MKPRVIYMGTPDFSVPALRRLAEGDLAEIALVVTQPDRPAGRGKKLVSPAVKLAADGLGLPVLQTGTLRDPEVRQQIIDIQPDLIVVAAFGMILGKWILELPARGCVNLHASLLPKYRGANPIAASIAMGEVRTGVTLMHMDRGLDTGAMYAAKDIDISAHDTTESLTPRLADVAGDLLEANLAGLLDGTLEATPQPGGATLTRQMTKDDGWLDWSRPAVELERHVRAMWSWPRAWTTADDGTRIQVHTAQVRGDVSGELGRITHDGKSVLVGCGTGALELVRLQLPGGKPIEGNAVLQAPPLNAGAVLGQAGGPQEIPPLVAPVD
jgi:methionyl-tRNA formyltransferase